MALSDWPVSMGRPVRCSVSAVSNLLRLAAAENVNALKLAAQHMFQAGDGRGVTICEALEDQPGEDGLVAGEDREWDPCGDATVRG